jgi:hypothetical protein
MDAIERCFVGTAALSFAALITSVGWWLMH